jgi:hypothetical protein
MRIPFPAHGILAAALAASAACSPSIDSVTVTQGADVNQIRVEAQIRGAAGVNLQTPRVSVARVVGGQDPAFNQAGDMAAAGGTLYARDPVTVPQGVIRVQVTVPYRVVFQPATQTLTRTQDFTVAAPAGCFFFDGTDPGTFTADGFFEIVGPAPGTRADICPGQSPFLAQGTNYPQAYSSPIPASFSSRAMMTNVGCVTNPPPLQSNFVVFDFASPALAGVDGWANANGFELQARVPFAAPEPDEQVRAQLIFQDPAGQSHAQLDASGNVVFHNLTGPWQPLSMSRPGLQVASLRIRMFIPRENSLSAPESRIEIDRVCPRTGG